ncbi:MAG: 30S ribosomal protein S12 methylthiotransferase RimO [Deltaproteobacteria bacterium CG11_big_fil_rev_8_21_14_0_20_45_16]|nr:MAG: 30S ribosomal protein S12 methylthiotransferase RimO [Deltaproteobacteria bacterium CG11_big_fil_rev_8_21_14_0_20_45_16]
MKSPKRHKVGFVSLGCPKNLVDTEAMISALSKNNISVTGDQNEADIIVINTCGFLEPAKQESLSTIDEFSVLKKKGKIQGLVVAGCMTERFLPLMKEKYPLVDAFLRTGEFSRIVPSVESILTDTADSRRSLLGECEPEQLSGHSEIQDYVERLPVKRPYAYVKISEGCDRRCSFCIIPKLRGKHHSRSIDGILDEILQLVSSGTKEIVFIAQDLTSYGRDLRNGTSLIQLLREVEKIEGLEWYRLMYNYPRFFSDDLIACLSHSQKFTGYLDIPFQHISDKVLKMMRRPESSLEIRKLITKLKENIPNLFLRTTLMIGFPGESAEDFEMLESFIDFAEFDHLGAFTYYRESGTASFDYPDQVSEEIKQERFEALMDLQKNIQTKLLKRHIGKSMDIMIDAFAERTRSGLLYRGRHRGQAPDVDGLTYVLSAGDLEIGQIYSSRIDKIAGDYDLIAEYESHPKQRAIRAN